MFEVWDWSWFLMVADPWYIFPDLLCPIYSPEGKPVLQYGLPAVAASLLATYDNCELLGSLEGGHTGWQTWLQSFGKSMKRKVSSYL